MWFGLEPECKVPGSHPFAATSKLETRGGGDPWGCTGLAVFSLAWATYELASGSFRPGSFGGKNAVSSHMLVGLFGSYAPYASGCLWVVLAILLFVIGRRRLAAARLAATTVDVESATAPQTVVPRERARCTIRRAYPTPTRKPRRKRQDV